MSFRPFFAALAATCVTLFQGCVPNATQSTPGDRSDEGSGKVALRLSAQALSALEGDGRYFQIDVSGPGMATMGYRQPIDTVATVQGIPCGTRYVRVTVLDSARVPYWIGSDTVEVNPDQFAWAHITLRKASLIPGNIHIDLDLDSGWVDTSRFSPDTFWRDSFFLPRDSLVDSLPNRRDSLVDSVLQGHDTIWVDTIVPPNWTPSPSFKKCSTARYQDDSATTTLCRRWIWHDTLPALPLTPIRRTR